MANVAPIPVRPPFFQSQYTEGPPEPGKLDDEQRALNTWHVNTLHFSSRVATISTKLLAHWQKITEGDSCEIRC